MYSIFWLLWIMFMGMWSWYLVLADIVKVCVAASRLFQFAVIMSR